MAGKRPTQKELKQIGPRLRMWRLVAGMSQVQVAEKVGCSKSHISQVENPRKENELSLDLFRAYCKAIKAPASKVLGDTLLPRERDVERLTADLVETLGAKQLARIAALTPKERRVFVERGFEAVELISLRRRDRIRQKSSPKTAATIHPIKRNR